LRLSRKIATVWDGEHIVKVDQVGGFRLRLTWTDGTVGDVDYAGRDWPGVLAPLNDPAFFAQVFINPESGTLTWPGEIDLAPEPLYEEARRNPVARPAAR
jgi:hypothetical protein